MKSVLIRSGWSPLLVEAGDLCGSRSSSARFAPAVCCSSRGNAYIPKLEPFSRSKFERGLKEPPLIQKCENELADYCSTLEGDKSYSCWRAYFELKDLEKESPKEEVERLIIQAGGLKSLIGCLHGIAEIHKAKKNRVALAKPLNSEERMEKHCPIPDGLPKSLEELEAEEMGRMPDSPYTRLLRSKGRFPAWYSPAPDHGAD
ncbi:CCG-binding protein 1 [Rhodamnia argentea]|uniref:CCG-binding protein 1 n=1 Tax=Rhodamnia argentea TaxID=178133 RepID=A0A8B8NM38_9MYRT|nr:CCG-binding protein 1 [Rhodamnia argentea]